MAAKAYKSEADRKADRIIGQRIRWRRKLARMSQSELAHIAGMADYWHVQDIERARHGVMLPVLRRIACALGCDIRDLVA